MVAAVLPYISERGNHTAAGWERIEAFLERCAALGVYVMYDLSFTWQPNGTHSIDLPALEYEIRRVRSYDAILSWYLSDEPEGRQVPPALLVAAAQRVRSLDDRPIAAVFCNCSDAHDVADYLPACDIVMADPYPVGARGGYFCPFTHEGCDVPARVTDAAANMRSLAPDKVLIMVPQTFGSLQESGGGAEAGWERNPTRADAPAVALMDVSMWSARLGATTTTIESTATLLILLPANYYSSFHFITCDAIEHLPGHVRSWGMCSSAIHGWDA